MANSVLDCDDLFDEFLNCNSNYLEESKLNTFFKSSNKFAINLIHINSRSLSKNFKQIISLISRISVPLTAIGVTETWLTNISDTSFQIDGYTFVSKSRDIKLEEVLAYT